MAQDTNFFVALLAERGLHVTESQMEQFEAYYRELVDWNERMNLTGITEKSQVYLKHFYDSLTLSFYVPFDGVATMADIGAGAGFPGIPLKIMYPHLKLTIIDSLQKRIQFLHHLVSVLGLTDVRCIHGRAEDIARRPEHRDGYDMVTARAVARMAVLNEFCLPFARIDGTFAAMKGADPMEEVEEAAYSLKELKGKLKTVYSFKLPMEESDRHIVVVKKTDGTPRAYPRKAGLPLKQPLIKK